MKFIAREKELKILKEEYNKELNENWHKFNTKDLNSQNF